VLRLEKAVKIGTVTFTAKAHYVIHVLWPTTQVLAAVQVARTCTTVVVSAVSFVTFVYLHGKPRPTAAMLIAPVFRVVLALITVHQTVTVITNIMHHYLQDYTALTVVWLLLIWEKQTSNNQEYQAKLNSLTLLY
jgi:hypothetical protein